MGRSPLRDRRIDLRPRPERRSPPRVELDKVALADAGSRRVRRIEPADATPAYRPRPVAVFRSHRLEPHAPSADLGPAPRRCRLVHLAVPREHHTVEPLRRANRDEAEAHIVGDALRRPLQRIAVAAAARRAHHYAIALVQHMPADLARRVEVVDRAAAPASTQLATGSPHIPPSTPNAGTIAPSDSSE